MITLDSVLATGKDTRRWVDNSAAEIEGIVFDVKPGGIGSANCGARDLVDRDTHIEIVRSIEDSGSTRRMIVEVTPRLRAMARARYGWKCVHWARLLPLRHWLCRY